MLLNHFAGLGVIKVLALVVAGCSSLASSTVDEDMSDTLLHSDLLTPMLHCFCDLLVTGARYVQSYTDASNLGVPAIGVYIRA